jgi:hypothetical protein
MEPLFRTVQAGREPVPKLLPVLRFFNQVKPYSRRTWLVEAQPELGGWWAIGIVVIRVVALPVTTHTQNY